MRAHPYFGRGQEFFKLRQFDRAAADFMEAIRLEPEDFRPYWEVGMVYQDRGDKASALEAYSKAILLNPRFVPAYSERGTAFLLDGKVDDAIQDFTKAIQIDPNNFSIYFRRGNAWKESGNNDKAIEDFTKAILINPKFSAAYLERGDAWELKSESVRALSDFDEAIRLNPNDGGQYLERGILQFSIGHYDAAVLDLNESARLDPALTAHSQIWRYLARSRSGDRLLATKGLLTDSTTLDQRTWPYAVVELFLGRRNPTSVLSFANGNAERRLDRTCDAHYFIGEYYLLNNRADDARAMLILAKQQCPRSLVNFMAAVEELNRLQH
ncbi:tetratricopeptide repeat protein [Paraburkholderia youngii]|uniref:tetratricopeptide repeat protein n=1 Tax=Paraburkholderia youngii TaxID=2782701 RepID=UPI003D1D963A